MAEKSVDWQEYFLSIKTICPWSWAAWRNNLIEIAEWHSTPSDLKHNEARLYTAPNHNPRQLKKISQRLNQQRPTEEWLWSHPKLGIYSTEIPVLIQQDRKRLENTRNNLSYKGLA